MSPTDAKKIIAALANGIDPETGEILSAESVFNHPRVIRALFVAMNALDRPVNTKSRAVSDGVQPEKAGKPWSDAEDEELLASFDHGTPVSTVAAKHGRTRGAIASRLVRLGRVKERSEVK